MRNARIVLLLAIALAGCGKKEPLRAADNQPLPPRPATAALQPTPTQLLLPRAQERPGRFNELVSKSEKLESDRFDLPPPG